MKVLRGGTLIDGTGAGPLAAATVVVRDQRIEAVTTRAGNGDWPSDAEVIDVSGMTILPGLIDCHDHMAMHGYDLARRWGIDEPQSTRALRTAKVLQETLAAGYTAVRDAARPVPVHHLADRRDRRSGQPVRFLMLCAQ